MKKRLGNAAVKTVLLLLGAAFCAPIPVLLSGSIMSRYELLQNLTPLTADGERFITWSFFPLWPTFAHYTKLLFQTPQFFIVFWNSMKLVACILLGQLLIAVPAAWAFAVYPFRFRKLLFTLYVVLMLMPFQVTMLSSYLVLDGLSLMNSHKAIILPAVFSTYPVFLVYRGFCSLPKGLIEAARIDGLNEVQIFFRMFFPTMRSTYAAAGVITFMNAWNAYLWPKVIMTDNNSITMPMLIANLITGYVTDYGMLMCGVLFCSIPTMIVFFILQKQFAEGITGAVK